LKTAQKVDDAQARKTAHIAASPENQPLIPFRFQMALKQNFIYSGAKLI
jgi:hypothetical protein